MNYGARLKRLEAKRAARKRRGVDWLATVFKHEHETKEEACIREGWNADLADQIFVVRWFTKEEAEAAEKTQRGRPPVRVDDFDEPPLTVGHRDVPDAEHIAFRADSRAEKSNVPAKVTPSDFWRGLYYRKDGGIV